MTYCHPGLLPPAFLPSEWPAGFLLPLCFVRGAEARHWIWKMAQQVRHEDYYLGSRNTLWQTIWSSSGKGAGSPWHSEFGSHALLLTERVPVFSCLMELPWRLLFKYAPFIELLQSRNMLGEALPLLSTQQRSGGERLTNWTALFRSLISNVIFFFPLSILNTCSSPVMLLDLGSESSGFAGDGQGGR